MKKIISVTSLILFVTACSSVEKQKDIPVPVVKPPISVKGWDPSWSDFTKSALQTYGKELLAANPRGLCPGDKITAYTNILIKLAKFESNYDPELEYKENFKDRFGNYVISTGIMQVSQESCGGYGMKTTTKQLKLVEKNLECAVRIMNKWVAADKTIAGGPPWVGASRYWSPFREESKRKIILACD